jgi:hypothetical protein
MFRETCNVKQDLNTIDRLNKQYSLRQLQICGLVQELCSYVKRRHNWGLQNYDTVSTCKSSVWIWYSLICTAVFPTIYQFPVYNLEMIPMRILANLKKFQKKFKKCHVNLFGKKRTTITSVYICFNLFLNRIIS